jgi:hypothetical protein
MRVNRGITEFRCIVNCGEIFKARAKHFLRLDVPSWFCEKDRSDFVTVIKKTDEFPIFHKV